MSCYIETVIECYVCGESLYVKTLEDNFEDEFCINEDCEHFDVEEFVESFK